MPSAAQDPAVAALPCVAEYGPVPQYPIESVDNALRVLVLIGQRRQLRLTDVSRYLGVASSTAHRLLAMLQYRGLIQQDRGSRTYVPGPAMQDLAFGLARRTNIREIAHGSISYLSSRLQETVHLAVLEQSDVHFIDSIESPRQLRVGSRVGRRMPAHCTATGKALLAQLSNERITMLYPRERLVQLTPRSIATRTELLRAVDLVQRRGFATSREESEPGVGSIALSGCGRHAPPFAITVSAPVTRLGAQERQSIVPRLRSAVAEIVGQLP